MRFIPPEVLLSWPVPNYDNPKTRGDALLIVNGIFISLATITVILRLYTRVFIKRWFGMDDFFIMLALVCHHHHQASPFVGLRIYTNSR